MIFLLAAIMKASILIYLLHENNSVFSDDPADTGIFLQMCQISGRCIFPKNTCIRKCFHYSFGVNNSSNIYLNICQKEIGVISVFCPVIAV